MSPMPSKLNLGCGKKKLPQHLNVDREPSVKPDLIHDLNVYPYPLPEGFFEEIHAYDVVEHLENLVLFMREVWRLAQPKARVFITTPHFSCANAYTDPTHVRQLGYFSFDYFTADQQWNYYGSQGFEITHRHIVFAPGLANKAVHRLANRYPIRYESRWAWMFPAWFVYFELTVRKG